MAEGRTMQEQLSRATQEQLPNLHLVNEYFELSYRSAPHRNIMEGERRYLASRYS